MIVFLCAVFWSEV